MKGQMFNGKVVILVVEDTALIRMSAIDLVRSSGYEALEASDADEAIRVLEARADIDWRSRFYRCRERWAASNLPTISVIDGRR
jgi:CheY-like chemotaxis protein